MVAEVATQAVGSVLGAVQGIAGLIEAGKDKRELNRLFKQRKALKTPAEIFDIVSAQQMNTESGYSPQTLEYLSGKANTGLSSTLGAATKLGADPNQLSGILDSYFKDIFKIGGENELVKMKKFDGFLNALQLLSQNKEAEQISADNLIKDQMQAVASRLAKDEKNIQSGGNLFLNGISGLAGTNMYGRGSANSGSATGGDPLGG